MPAFSTHYIFAKEMMPKIKEAANFEINENAVYIGTQGPDIFFFHRIFPWQKGKSLRKAGSAFHRAKFGDVLDDFAVYCKYSDNKPVAQSYVIGFILHYALDRNCHPYVYSLQNKITQKNSKLNPNSVHNTIELSIDSVMLNLKYGVLNPKNFATANLINCTDEEKQEIAKVLVSAKSEIAPLTFSENDVQTAIEDMKYAQKLLFDPTGKKEKLIKPLENAAAPFTKNFKLSSFIKPDDLEKAKKYVNINSRAWISPFSNIKSRESFFDLYEKSKADAINMITAYLNENKGQDITHNLSFLTGVEVK